MPQYPIHTIDSAPSAAQPLLETFKQRYTFVPNLIALLASSPVAVESYDAVYGALARGRFSPAEGQLLALAISVANGCEYCVAAHSMVATMQQLPANVIAAVREGRPIDDPHLQALRAFAQAVVTTRGRVDPGDHDRFFAAGFDSGHAFEVLTWVALKTLSNYANHLARTPVDAAFASHAWTGPSNQ